MLKFDFFVYNINANANYSYLLSEELHVQPDAYSDYIDVTGKKLEILQEELK